MITFLQKANYIGNTFKLMKTFINGTVIHCHYLCRALSRGCNDLLLNQIIICRPFQCHAKYFCDFPNTKQNIMVYIPVPSIFRWILHHYNLLTYSNDHRKNSSYNYKILLRLIYFYIYIFNFFGENKNIINMHTILLTKYEMRVQRRSNINIY